MGGSATTDAVALLHELGMRISVGSSGRGWLVRSPDGSRFEVEPGVPTPRLTAHRVRATGAGHLATPDRLLHVGTSATDGVVQRAETGVIDILTAEPIRLNCDGRSFTMRPGPWTQAPLRPPHRGRPAWIRWALQRYLLLTAEPARQSVIADSPGTSQQSISRAAHQLDGLVVDHGVGLTTADRAALLARWRTEYSGPEGQEFGWYSLDSVGTQVERAVDVTRRLDVEILVGGDVAADQLAPWKRPARGRVYVAGPIDLGGDGSVAVPVAEAGLVTCVPRDPSLWRLAQSTDAATRSDDLPLVDAVIVYWDLVTSTDLDSDGAADRIASLLVGGTP